MNCPWCNISKPRRKKKFTVLKKFMKRRRGNERQLQDPNLKGILNLRTTKSVKKMACRVFPTLCLVRARRISTRIHDIRAIETQVEKVSKLVENMRGCELRQINDEINRLSRDIRSIHKQNNANIEALHREICNTRADIQYLPCNRPPADEARVASIIPLEVNCLHSEQEFAASSR